MPPLSLSLSLAPLAVRLQAKLQERVTCHADQVIKVKRIFENFDKDDSGEAPAAIHTYIHTDSRRIHSTVTRRRDDSIFVPR